MRQNERVHFRIHNSAINYTYYMIAIADADVDLILPFTLHQDKFFTQTQRLGVVRFGSQTSLVLPIDGRFDMYLRNPDMCHVEASIDPLVDIIDRVKQI